MNLKKEKEEKYKKEIIGGEIGKWEDEKEEFDLCFSTVSEDKMDGGPVKWERAKVQPTEAGTINKKA